jgi:hypothetical protein
VTDPADENDLDRSILFINLQPGSDFQPRLNSSITP